MTISLAFQEATVYPNGKAIDLRFSVAKPAAYGTPDRQPGYLAGLFLKSSLAGVEFEALGAWSQDYDYPCDANSLLSGSLGANAHYYFAAAAVQNGVEVYFSPIHFIVLGSGGGFDFFFPLGPQAPAGTTFNIYLATKATGPSGLTLYKSGVTSSNCLLTCTDAFSAGGTPRTGKANLDWHCVYRPSRFIVVGETFTLTGSAALWQDAHGNQTASFNAVNVPAATASADGNGYNNSMVDATGYTSSVFIPDNTGVTLYVQDITRGGVVPSDAYTYTQAKNSQTHPLATWQAAADMAKNNGLSGTWWRIAGLRGGTWTAGVSTTPKGKDFLHPGVFDSYWNNTFGADPATWPEIDCTRATGFSYSSASAVSDYVLLRDIFFKQIDLDNSNSAVGIKFVTHGRFTTVDNCKTQYFAGNTFQGFGSSNNYDFLSIMNPMFLDNFGTNVAHVNNYVAYHSRVCVSDAFIDRCGGQTSDGLGVGTAYSRFTTNFDHGLYLDYHGQPVTVMDGLVNGAASYGVHHRTGGIQADMHYSHCPIATELAQPGGYLHCVVSEKGENTNPYGTAAALASGGTVSFTNNSTAVVGTGTRFDLDIATNAALRPAGRLSLYRVASVTDATHATLVNPYLPPSVSGVGGEVAALAVQTRGFGPQLFGYYNINNLTAGPVRNNHVAENVVCCNYDGGTGTQPRGIECFWHTDQTAVEQTVRNCYVHGAAVCLYLSGAALPSPTSGLSITAKWNVLHSTSGNANYVTSYIPSAAPDGNIAIDENDLAGGPASPIQTGAGNKTVAAWRTFSGCDAHSITSIAVYINSSADLGTYYQSIGGTNSETDYLTALRGRAFHYRGDLNDCRKRFRHYRANQYATAVGVPAVTANEYYGATPPLPTSYAQVNTGYAGINQPITFDLTVPANTAPAAIDTVTLTSTLAATFSLNNTPTLTDQFPHARVVLTPTAAGAGTLTFSNGSGLTDPVAISLGPANSCTVYVVTLPDSCNVGQASGTCTISASPIGSVFGSTTRVTVSVDDGSTVTTSPVTIAAGGTMGTFTITALTRGLRTATPINDAGLSNPAPQTITAYAVRPAAGVRPAVANRPVVVGRPTVNRSHI